MCPVVVDSVSEDSSTVEGECTIHIALALALEIGVINPPIGSFIDLTWCLPQLDFESDESPCNS